MKSYELKLGSIACELRITAGAQKELLLEKGKSFLEIMLDCMMDPLNCVDVFEKALNFKGNGNIITSGEDLYDAMVDAGYEGAERFFDVLTRTAQVSGVINADQKKKIDKAMKGVNEGIYKKITDVEKFFKDASDSVKDDTEQSTVAQFRRTATEGK